MQKEINQLTDNAENTNNQNSLHNSNEQVSSSAIGKPNSETNLNFSKATDYYSSTNNIDLKESDNIVKKSSVFLLYSGLILVGPLIINLFLMFFNPMWGWFLMLTAPPLLVYIFLVFGTSVFVVIKKLFK